MPCGPKQHLVETEDIYKQPSQLIGCNILLCPLFDVYKIELTNSQSNICNDHTVINPTQITRALQFVCSDWLSLASERTQLLLRGNIHARWHSRLRGNIAWYVKSAVAFNLIILPFTHSPSTLVARGWACFNGKSFKIWQHLQQNYFKQFLVALIGSFTKSLSHW